MYGMCNMLAVNFAHALFLVRGLLVKLSENRVATAKKNLNYATLRRSRFARPPPLRLKLIYATFYSEFDWCGSLMLKSLFPPLFTLNMIAMVV